MQIAIVGTGYVGLVSGACMAENGHDVICIDIDENKINSLLSGKIPIFEPGLEEIVKRNAAAGRLHFTTDYNRSKGASAFFIAVPTPSRSDGSCDISYVEEAARQIATILQGYAVIVNKSTVPVGTAERVKEIIQEKTDAFDVVSNPEFLKEGAAIQDCLFPDRIVIGSSSEKATAILKEIYAGYLGKLLVMDPISAEMTKYAANAMLALRISFMNEIADICKKKGANVNEVRVGIGMDPRIGLHFLFPGVGYGGSCFPKDVRALIAMAKDAGSDPLLLQAVETINERQKKLLPKLIQSYFATRGHLLGKTIAIWGLSFKPNTDDMRDAPSLDVIDALVKEGALLRLFDPVAMENAKKIIGNSPQITWCESVMGTTMGAHAVALITEWKEFSLVDFDQIKKTMSGLALFDGRNQFNSLLMKKHGFDYIPIGAPDGAA